MNFSRKRIFQCVLLTFLTTGILSAFNEISAKNIMETSHMPSDPSSISTSKDLKKLKLPFDYKPSKISLESIKIQDLKTPQGFSVWFVQNKDIPVVTLQLMFKDAGAKNEIKGKYGLLALFCAMIDEGAGDYDSQGFKRFLIEHNIDLSVNHNDDTFVIGFSVPKSAVQKAFEAIKLILVNLRLLPEDLVKVKSHLLVGYKQSLENESQKAFDTLGKILAPDHPYSTTVKDRLEDLNTISTDDLREYMENHLTKDRVILSVCGSIENDDLLAAVDDALKELPEKAHAKEISDIIPEQLGTTHHVVMDIPQSLILFAHPGFKRNDPDYFSLDLALNIFGSGEFGSRLMKRVREERGLVYGISVSPLINKHMQLILGNAPTRTQTVDQVISLIRSEWHNLIANGVSSDELEQEKQRTIGAFPLRVASTKGIVSILTAIQYHHLGIDYLGKRTEEIQKINFKDLNSLLKTRFRDDWLTFLTVGRVSNEEDKPHQEGTSQKEKSDKMETSLGLDASSQKMKNDNTDSAKSSSTPEKNQENVDSSKKNNEQQKSLTEQDAIADKKTKKKNAINKKNEDSNEAQKVEKGEK